MKFLLEFIKTLLTRTGKTKGLNNQTKNEIVQMLTEANESVLKGNKKIDDQIAELRKIEEKIFKAEKTSGETNTVIDRPQRMSSTMFEGPERSIAFVSEKTGLNVDRAKAAVLEKMNEAYPPGSPKRATAEDDDMIKAYLDNNLGYSSDDAIGFLEEIEEIGKNIDTDNIIDIRSAPKKKEGLTSLTNPDDADIKKFLEEQGIGKTSFDPEKGIVQSPAASKEKAKRIIATENAPDEFFGKAVEDLTPDDVDSLRTDKFVDDTVETRRNLEGLDNTQLTELAGKMARQVAANERKIANLIDAGEFDKARELEELNKKTLDAMSGEGLEDLDQILDLFPFDPDKPKMAEGGRIGFQDGGGKFPISRRGFLGVLGGGITAALTGGKGLLPAAKTGITAAKTLSAPGMPKWFPLLVGKIQTKGNLVSPAAPNKGEINAVYKYKDGMTEYRMVEDVNTGRIDIYTTADDGTQVSFEYEPSMKKYFEDGSSVTEDPSFFVGEFRKGHEGAADLEQYSMGMDEVVSDLRNIEDFATRGTTMKVDEAIEDFVKRTRTEEPGFKQGGLVPPQAGPMSSGMGSLFRQRTI
tara:strand:- start:42 stop:1784 length:1743 start_codon:yes stop_codon:yes gene_type:complete